MRSIIAFVAFVSALVSALGCSSTTTVQPTPTPPMGVLGKEGKIGFSLHSNTGKTTCTFGCGLMVGTDENVRIDPGPPADSTIESSDPAVVIVMGQATSTSSKGSVLDGFGLRAKTAGSIELRIKSAAGQILDRIDLAVEVPTEVTFGTAPKTVKVGESISFAPTAIAKNGVPMQSSLGWTFSGDAPAVAEVGNGCAVICYGNNDFITVKGLAAGTFNVTATGAGTKGTLAMTVTP